MLRSLLLLLLALLSIVATSLPAQECAGTPEIAAHSVFRVAAVESSSPAAAGYRLEDVQVDPVLRRAWGRVRRCDDASAPAILVPLLAPGGGLLRTITAQHLPEHLLVAGLRIWPLERSDSFAVTSRGGSAPAVLPKVVLVHAGDAVHAVFQSNAVHMDLAATANQQGVEGDSIQLTLKRRTNQLPEEPEQRMRGIVHADRSIEVQP